jgi:YggT family protein
MALICIALTVYWFVLIARIILSWVTMAGSVPSGLAPAVKVIYDLTEPVLGLFRRMIPPLGPLDISPIFAFIILSVIQRALGCGGIF